MCNSESVHHLTDLMNTDAVMLPRREENQKRQIQGSIRQPFFQPLVPLFLWFYRMGLFDEYLKHTAVWALLQQRLQTR